MKFVAALIVLISGAFALEETLLGQEEIVKFINTHEKATWTAGINTRFQGLEIEDIKYQMGTKLKGGPVLPEKEMLSFVVPPTSFDSRTNWPNCPSISEVRDQGSCGSCWAFGAVEAMTDRYCIHMNQTAHVSAEDLTSCCKSCGNGCGGGFPTSAWYYWIQSGIVTGGQYDTKTGCQPYLVKACDHHVVGQKPPCAKVEENTPKCSTRCEAGYTTSYKTDKHFGVSAHSFRTVAAIQMEIMTNGPVEATMRVYEDFLTYKTGVYKHMSGSMLGGHAIRILGWGVDSGTAFWIVANSWNSDWGNKGFFNIESGRDEVGIESGVVAGMPKKYMV